MLRFSTRPFPIQSVCQNSNDSAMSSEIVIKAENLSKRYRLGELHKQTNSFREKVTRAFGRLMHNVRRKPNDPILQSEMSNAGPVSPANGNGVGRGDRAIVPCTMPSSSDEAIWALRDISLEVKRGDIVGIIGRNGSGKTTLLKILSRITKPTEGRAWINGRVGSLLEVGTGFHPELTGRENIYLNGAILGMTKVEIKKRFDEIVEFAEVGRFIDTPVKRYSSGMYVRLAFSVAAHLETEILLVDEVLAVGDTVFQKKCIGKIGKVARGGKTILFVSHNMSSVKRICNTVIHIMNGRIVESGESNSIISNYLQSNLSMGSSVEFSDKIHNHESTLQIKNVEILNSNFKPSVVFFYNEEIKIRLGIIATESVNNARIGIGINSEGIRISTTHTPPINIPQSYNRKYIACTIPANVLNPGFYSLHLGAHSIETGRSLDWIPDAVSFTISPVSRANSIAYDEKNKGFVMLNVVWEGELL